jgi:hypothetical protein
MKLKSLNSIASTLEEAGYSTTRDESAIFVEIAHDGQIYPAVLQLQDDALHVTCQLGKLSDFEPDQLSLVTINALAANVEMLPYAFAIIKPDSGADVSAVEDSPLVLINSVPVADLSEDELLWDLQKLQSALLSALNAIASAVRVSQMP